MAKKDKRIVDPAAYEKALQDLAAETNLKFLWRRIAVQLYNGQFGTIDDAGQGLIKAKRLYEETIRREKWQTHKPCKQCGEVKPLMAFEHYSRCRDGRRNVCRDCRNHSKVYRRGMAKTVTYNKRAEFKAVFEQHRNTQKEND